MILFGFELEIPNEWFLFEIRSSVLLLEKQKIKIEKEEYMSKVSNYKFNQIFGYKGPNERVHEQDIITAIKFDNKGKFLALGDRAGRVIVFEASSSNNEKKEKLDYYAEFQSHSKEFDCLRSMEVEESIVGMEWLKGQGKYEKIMTTNARSIKVWKIFEQSEKKVVKSAGKDLNMPKVETVDKSFVANVQGEFPCKHSTDIKEISVASNEEYFLSFDEVQGFLWNMEKKTTPYIVQDFKGDKEIEDVKENITCGKYHPHSDSIFSVGTDKGTLHTVDLRQSSLKNKNTLKFSFQSTGPKNFFTEYVNQYSSTQFLKGGKYLAARDFLSVKVWDVSKTNKPILSIPLEQGYKAKLCEMFENDSIFDKFKLSSSKDGNHLLTGSYNNNFHMLDLLSGLNVQYELNYKKNTINKEMVPGKGSAVGKMDYNRKVLACDFNPQKNAVAVASQNTFFIYSI